MRPTRRFRIQAFAAFVLTITLLALTTGSASAHCDTLDGPVVQDAKLALRRGDVTPVLKWVTKEQEPEVRSVFQKTLIVRDKGLEARELADMYFFGTLVRLHRASEGAPYTGLQPAGAEEPAVAAADAALEKGSGEALASGIAAKVAAGIWERFGRTLELRKRAEESVAAGRAYVGSYVGFIHYVERLHQDAEGHAVHHAEGR